MNVYHHYFSFSRFLILLIISLPSSLFAEIEQTKTKETRTKETITGINSLGHPLYQRYAEVLDESIPEVNLRSEHKQLRRAIRDVGQGKADFYFPEVCLESLLEEDLRFGQERIGYLAVGLVSHKDRPLNLAEIKSAKYTMDINRSRRLANVFSPKQIKKLSALTQSYVDQQALTDAAERKLGVRLDENQRRELALAAYPYVLATKKTYARYNPIPTSGDFSPSLSLKSLERGRIDGYILRSDEIDRLIKEQGMEDKVHRVLYLELELCFVVANTLRGKYVDEKISAASKATKRDGSFDNIFGEFYQAQKDWADKYRER